jgi:hypothetical protein
MIGKTGKENACQILATGGNWLNLVVLAEPDEKGEC